MIHYTIKESIEIAASAEKVWNVLTLMKFVRQWDEVPEDFTGNSLELGSVIEWPGYSTITVGEFEPDMKLRLSLFLPKAKLKADEYKISYLYVLTENNGKTRLEITIGDFSPLPNAKGLYDASLEFAKTSKNRIKELAEDSNSFS